MNAHAVSTQILSGTFKHGAGRIILVALGCTVATVAVVAAVVVRQSPGDETSSNATTAGAQVQVPSGSLPVSRPGRLPEATVRTTYFVASPEHADALRIGIADANAIRLAVGEPLMFDTVLLVASDAEAEATLAAIVDGNRLLASLGEPEENVVDLRAN